MRVIGTPQARRSPAAPCRRRLLHRRQPRRSQRCRSSGGRLGRPVDRAGQLLLAVAGNPARWSAVLSARLSAIASSFPPPEVRYSDWARSAPLCRLLVLMGTLAAPDGLSQGSLPRLRLDVGAAISATDRCGYRPKRLCRLSTPNVRGHDAGEPPLSILEYLTCSPKLIGHRHSNGDVECQTQPRCYRRVPPVGATSPTSHWAAARDGFGSQHTHRRCQASGCSATAGRGRSASNSTRSWYGRAAYAHCSRSS